MATRVTSNQGIAHGNVAGAVNSNFYPLQGKTSTLVRSEDTGTRENPLSKRLHRTGLQPNGESSTQQPENKSTTESRGKSYARPISLIKDSQTPQRHGSLQQSPSKRLSSSFTSQPAVLSAVKGKNAGQLPLDKVQTFNFGSATHITKHDGSSTSIDFDFLPEVHFDDFHASLAAEEPDLNSSPTPRGSVLIAPQGMNGTGSKSGRKYFQNETMQRRNPSDSSTRIGRSGSFLRRQDFHVYQATNVAGTTVASESSATLVATASKSRRKSHFPIPPSANENVGKPPRKSVGPGILTSGLGERSMRQRPSFEQSIDPSEGSTVSKLTGISIKSSEERLRSLGPSRSKRTKSLQPPKLVEDYTSSSSVTPEQLRSLTSSSQSPPLPTGYRTNSPVSAKRLSMMPGSVHVSGLGARTISPTDARRLKRMSVIPNPPPIPSSPPTPQLDHSFPGVRSSTHSPSIALGKSLTPSSSRTTPEANRKSYSSGISNSSITSYGSILNSAGSLRISQSASASRLPTLKTRIDNFGPGTEEEVPPVPAIPKAYESPKTEFDQPFFNFRKSSLPFDNSSQYSVDNVLPLFLNNESANTGRGQRQKKDAFGEGTIGISRKPSIGAGRGGRTLQPLRLPPLNLLPLGTPTTAKVAALSGVPAMATAGNFTPPPKPGAVPLPSTPLTASRATFISKDFRDEFQIPVAIQRPNSSSHQVVIIDSPSYSDASTTVSTGQAFREQLSSRASRKAISPFVSSSLPKCSSESSRSGLKIAEFGSLGNGLEHRTSKLTGPRLPASIKDKYESRTFGIPSPTRSITPSVNVSLRHKLSVSRERSSSKTQLTTAENDMDIPPKPPRHDQMPPPRLPASATWNGPFLNSPSPTHKLNNLTSGRKISNTNSTSYKDGSQYHAWGIHAGQKESVISDSTVTSRSSKSIMPNYESNPLNLKEYLRETKNLEMQLDRDDFLAEDEIKTLASKRKDTETLAKELDSLYRRATSKERVSPNQALRMAHLNLNIFERGEIFDYKDIYFCGTRNAKKHVGDLTAENMNFGYDDERGDYNIVNGDHLFYRYEIVDVLGKGSFGQVVRCIDHKTGGLVAIKIIRNKKRFHQQALVEVDILQKLKEWDPNNRHCMVNFTQSFYFRDHLCICTELLGMNLYELIKSHEFRGFSLKLVRRFSKQLLSSLLLLKAHKVIHCDLKPENILLTHPARSEIKVIDFGSSCLANEKVYTYIQSRFYRSPEVILGMTYGLPIDMWSLGCILAELLTGYPIFPGGNEQEQLACIMEVFGPPEKHLIEKSTRKKLFFDSLGKPRLTISQKGKRRRPSSKSLQQVLKCEDEAFLDFISRCLRWDPDRRLKPDEAIRHEFISGPKPSSKPLRPQLTTSTSSPVKRYTSIHTSGVRPLPEPPATSFKNGTAVRTRESSSDSPIKPNMGPKRHSTVHSSQSSSGVKRGLNGNTIAGSALPRVTSRTLSGKADMATAAAAASLKPR